MRTSVTWIVAAVAMSYGCGSGGGDGGEEDSGTDAAADTAGDPDAEDVPAEPDAAGDPDALDAADAPDAASDGPDLHDFEWDAPEMPERYGYFQVQQVEAATGTISYAGGDFADYSAVEPERPLWADDVCTVVTYRNDPPDAEGYVRLGAGSPLTVGGGGGEHAPITCTWDEHEGYTCDLPEAPGTVIFSESGGETLTIEAPGDEVEAFSLEVPVPPPVASTSPATIEKGAGFTASWEAVDAEGMVVAIVVGDYASSLEGGVSIQCIVDISAEPPPTEFELPDVALSLLPSTGMGPGGEFNVGIMQLMALTTLNETLGDSTVVEVMVMNGGAQQITVTD